MQRESDVCESVWEVGVLAHGCRRCRAWYLCVCAVCVCVTCAGIKRSHQQRAKSPMISLSRSPPLRVDSHSPRGLHSPRTPTPRPINSLSPPPPLQYGGHRDQMLRKPRTRTHSPCLCLSLYASLSASPSPSPSLWSSLSASRRAKNRKVKTQIRKHRLGKRKTQIRHRLRKRRLGKGKRKRNQLCAAKEVGDRTEGVREPR